MNKTDLKEAAGISFNVIAKMGKNETVSFESIDKICYALNCNIGDIILENGKVVSNCNELDLVTGIILCENEKILVIDAYERERESPCPGFTKEYNELYKLEEQSAKEKNEE